MIRTALLSRPHSRENSVFNSKYVVGFIQFKNISALWHSNKTDPYLEQFVSRTHNNSINIQIPLRKFIKIQPTWKLRLVNTKIRPFLSTDYLNYVIWNVVQ